MEMEPWMRGTHGKLDPLQRAVVHALELAGEDAERWCAPLGEDALFAQPAQLPSVAFHMRHIVRSLDRLLTYAEDRQLNEQQLAMLGTENAAVAPEELWREFRTGLERAIGRIAAADPARLGEARGIGRKRLPTTVAGLLIHCAEHTQRHAGQMVTTAKMAERAGGAEGTA